VPGKPGRLDANLPPVASMDEFTALVDFLDQL
jgi:hypothetical protein